MTRFFTKKHHYFLLASIIFYIIILVFLYSNRFESYIYYQRISFDSSGARIYANLYYPNKQLTFQDKAPLIIFAHGLGSQKDMDIRVPNEFTKRGFFVASLDYRGDGESSGGLLDINHESYRNRTNVPAIAQECSKLLDVIETLPVYSKINSSQIGLIGHSLGGMVVLMNGALDNRFKVTVTWAALVNFSAKDFYISETDPFMNYIPSKIVNSTNPLNLLAIQSVYDTVVPYKQNALVLQKLTSCPLINITSNLIGSPHSLLSNKVLMDSIEWIESKFFYSTSINGPIQLSYLYTFSLLFLGLIGLYLLTLAIIKYSSKYFAIDLTKDKGENLKKKYHLIPERKKIHLKEILKIAIYYSGFVGLWIIFYMMMGIVGIIIVPIIIILIYFCTYLIKYIITAEKIGQKVMTYIELHLKNEIKAQFHRNVILYSFFSIFIFLSLYISYSLLYPFAFFSPVNIVDFILTYSIYPFYLAIELFYRKIIYPRLYWIKYESNKTILTSIMALLNVIILMVLSFHLFVIQSLLVTYLIFLSVIIMNSLIYEKTRKFSSVMISSFIIIQIFFGSAISAILGIGSIFQIFL